MPRGSKQAQDLARFMNVPKLLKQAEKLVSYGKTAEAIEVYHEILSEDFQNNQVHSLIADLYIEKKDMQRASRHLFKIASDWSAQGNSVEAAASYRRIIKILPKNTLAREKLLEILTVKLQIFKGEAARGGE